MQEDLGEEAAGGLLRPGTRYEHEVLRAGVDERGEAFGDLVEA